MTWIRSIEGGDFPGGPMVEDLPSSAGDMGLIPSQGGETPHGMGQPSLQATAKTPHSQVNK